MTKKNKKNVCSECINKDGGCCVGVNFNIHKSEVLPFLEIEKNGGYSDKHTFYRDKDDKDQYYYNSRKERCVHLNDDNICIIYSERPLMCRMYPILWKKDNIYIDMICPLTHFLPLRNIAFWPNDPKNKAQLIHMEELDFDGRSRQYINLKSLKAMNDALAPIIEDPDMEI